MSAIRKMHLCVIIPTYNRHASLRKTVASILNCDSVEGLTVTVLVVDNNSRDETRETVMQIAKENEGRVQYLFEAKQGQPAAINAGISQAKGDLIAFIDDDEEVFPDWLKVIYSQFLNENIGFLTGKCVPVWNGTIPAWLPPYRYGLVGAAGGEHPFPITDLNKGILFLGGTSIVRKKFISQVGGYAEWLTYGNDAEFGVKLVNAGAIGLYCPELRIYHDIPASRLTKTYVRKRAMMNHVNTVQIRRRWPSIDKLVLGFPIKLAYYKVVKLFERLGAVLTGRAQSLGKIRLRIDPVGFIWICPRLVRMGQCSRAKNNAVGRAPISKPCRRKLAALIVSLPLTSAVAMKVHSRSAGITAALARAGRISLGSNG